MSPLVSVVFLLSIFFSSSQADNCHRTCPSPSDSVCQCNSDCDTFGDCCHGWTSPTHYPRTSCLPSGFQAVSKCNKDWRGDITLCENQPDKNDLLAFVPASSGNRIYKNYHCSICNFDNSTIWQADILAENGISKFRIRPPRSTVTFRSCNPHLVSSCPDYWVDEQVRMRCLIYSGPVLSRGIYYKNIDCALCHNAHSDSTTCYNPPPHNGTNIEQFYFDLPSISRSRRDATEEYSVEFQISVKIPLFPEDYKMINRTIVQIFSKDVHIAPSEYYQDGSILYVSTSWIESAFEIKEKEIGASEWLNCRKKVFRNPYDYNLSQDSVYVKSENKSYDYFIAFDSKLYVCNNESLLISDMEGLFDDDDDADENPVTTFGKTTRIIADVCEIISIICLIAHLTFFGLIPEMRNLPGLNLASLCISLIFMYIAFIWNDYVDYSVVDNKTECIVISTTGIIFLLSSCLWMNAIAIDIFRTMYLSTKSLRLSGQENKWQRYFIYAIYGWGIPFIMLITIIILETVPTIPLASKFNFSPPDCNAENPLGILILLAVLIVELLANILLFTWSSCLIWRSSMKPNRSDSIKQKLQYSLYIRLAVVTGFTWVMRFLALPLDPYLGNLDDIFINLQGTLIFILFTCSHPKVKKILCRTKENDLSTNTASVKSSTAAENESLMRKNQDETKC